MDKEDKDKFLSIRDSNDVFDFPIHQLKECLTHLHAPNSKGEFVVEDYQAIENKLKLALQLRLSVDQSESAKKQSNFALIIATIALLLSFTQVGLSVYQIWFDDNPIAVYIIENPKAPMQKPDLQLTPSKSLEKNGTSVLSGPDHMKGQ